MFLKKAFTLSLVTIVLVLSACSPVIEPPVPEPPNLDESGVLDEGEVLDEVSPENIVTDFYTCHIQRLNPTNPEQPTTPSSDELCGKSKIFTASFIDRLDELTASFGEQGCPYDPILCAQDVPDRFEVKSVWHNAQVTASVLVQTSFENHFILVELLKSEAGWQIDDILCMKEPANVVRAFYTWYLAYTGGQYAEEFHNPLSEKAYQSSPFLSEDLKKKLDEIGASEQGFQFDPFLHAQSFPESFQVEEDQDKILVTLTFGPTSKTKLETKLIETQGKWEINEIIPLK
jgi:hypothetical protein